MHNRDKHTKHEGPGIRSLIKVVFILCLSLLFFHSNTLKAQVLNNNGAAISVTSLVIVQGDTSENTTTLNFGNTTAQSSNDLTVTVTGVTSGDAVVLGIPNASTNANSTYTAWVSSADTVTVRFNNYSAVAINPGNGTFRVSVLKY